MLIPYGLVKPLKGREAGLLAPLTVPQIIVSLQGVTMSNVIWYCMVTVLYVWTCQHRVQHVTEQGRHLRKRDHVPLQQPTFVVRPGKVSFDLSLAKTQHQSKAMSLLIALSA